MQALFASLYAMLLTAVAAVVPAAPLAMHTGFAPSQRHALALRREEAAANPVLEWFVEDVAVGAEVRDIAVGSILLVVSFVISLVMYPILTSSVATAQADGNSTTAQIALLGLLPTVFIIVLVIAGVRFLLQGIQKFGS